MAAIATPTFMSTQTRVLVVSADAAFRRHLMKRNEWGESVNEEAVGGAHALTKLVQFPCGSVLLDRQLPDLDAGEVADLIRQRFPGTVVEFVDSRLTVPRMTEIRFTGTEVASPSSSKNDGAEAEMESQSHWAEPVAEPLPGMLGTSRAMQQVYRLARMVAPRDTTVLIMGETGTGKELVAEGIHQLSGRARQPFVVVNCAAIPEALLEAELFGHARGAFTGAVQSRLGRIHVAQGGTLFLDEIGELPLSMQSKLLRFLQNGEVQRLGSPDVHRVDVRVVGATNVRLLDLVQKRQFRLDLYYRLAVFPILLPPLRDRVEDIGQLVNYSLMRLSKENGLPLKQVADAALAFLQRSHWAGNVRELQHAVERAFILSGNETQLRVEHFQPSGESVHLGEM